MSWASESADGRGRSLLDIVLGRNMKKIEDFQYHNPFKAKIGNCVFVEHDLSLSGINFFIKGIYVYETILNNNKFYDTEYELVGQSFNMDKPKYLRLRVTADAEIDPTFPYKLQILERYDEMAWDESFWNYLNDLPDGRFDVNQADDGTELTEARSYWRVDGAVEPYSCSLTILKDAEELEHRNVVFWDFSRETTDENLQPFIEYLNVEMCDDTKYFTLYRGKEVKPFQVRIV